ncbi:MAG: hypothetical protein UF412_05845 [Anaerostipes hadrus]|nr:hypothetical protein [Anaerostipes hadrus]
MKIYKFGDPSKPTIMLFPGTCCYWRTNFGHVFENLQKYFYIMVVSYSGFDETENTTFISELDEVAKVEDYIQSELDGKLFAAYGCSLGGSFVSLLVNRQKIHIDHAIIGSSDMDQAPKWLAKIETAIVLPLFYPFITGKKNCFLRKKIDKRSKKGGDETEYIKKFLQDWHQMIRIHPNGLLIPVRKNINFILIKQCWKISIFIRFKAHQDLFFCRFLYC